MEASLSRMRNIYFLLLRLEYHAEAEECTNTHDTGLFYGFRLRLFCGNWMQTMFVEILLFATEMSCFASVPDFIFIFFWGYESFEIGVCCMVNVRLIMLSIMGLSTWTFHSFFCFIVTSCANDECECYFKCKYQGESVTIHKCLICRKGNSPSSSLFWRFSLTRSSQKIFLWTINNIINWHVSTSNYDVIYV